MPLPDPIKVVPATPADIDTIHAVIMEAAEWLLSRGIMQWTEKLPRDWVAGCVERGEFQIARQRGQVVGTFRLVWTDEDHLWGEPVEAGYVGKLVVARSAAGRGLGLELLAAAEGIVAAAGRRWLRLDCWSGNSFLCGYYERAGFRRGDTVSHRDYLLCLFEKAAG